MDIKHRDETLTLNFESGINVEVDLRRANLTDDHLRILDKLARESGSLDSSECKDGHCPAQAVLEPDEFEKVRGLYVGLREIPVEAAGPFIDFCLHVINVHQVNQQVDDE